jgi:hypothetical protein
MEIQYDRIPEQVKVEGMFSMGAIFLDGKHLDPLPSLKVRNHSPDGFSWGYGGSGPAQLALAILLKYVPAEYAEELYQSFKIDHVANWPREDFQKSIWIRNWISAAMHMKTEQ